MFNNRSRLLPGAPLAPTALTASAATETARVVARRPGLPGGRAVVGALLVVTAGVGTFTLGGDGDGGANGEYPVLVRSLNPGERVVAADIEWRAMALDEEVTSSTFTDATEVVGGIALTTMRRGELVQRSDVADVNGGPLPSAQLSIPVPVDRVPPGVGRGERVTLLATYGSGTSATTVRTVENALVLAYYSDPGSIGSSERGQITLALVDPTTLVAAAHAAQVAELTVVRTTGTSTVLPETYRRDDLERPRA